MNSGIYYPLFLVLVADPKHFACYYVASDLQPPEIFSPRKPLSASARRSGWQGFMYILKEKKQAFVRLF
jgi:type II restriction enzyme